MKRFFILGLTCCQLGSILTNVTQQGRQHQTINQPYNDMNKINITEFAAYAERAMAGRYSTRSTEDRAILVYMAELVDNLRCHDVSAVSFAQDIERICLNGASDWQHYSFSGCSLCYNDQIAGLILPPSRRNRYGSERLLVMQGYMLSRACLRLKRLFNEYKRSVNA